MMIMYSVFSDLLLPVVVIGTIVHICRYTYGKKNKPEVKQDEASESEEKDTAQKTVPTVSVNVETKNKMLMNDFSNLETKDLCLEILKRVNCQVIFDDDDPDRLLFTFQGEHFVINASNGYRMIVIWDMFWYSVDVENLEEVSLLRKAINNVNLNGPRTLVYTITEDKKMWVHTKFDTILDPGITDVQNYLPCILGFFFDTKRSLMSEIDRLRNEEKK